jgi:energy-coupling factor transporter ATP-binding protein EcfA2
MKYQRYSLQQGLVKPANNQKFQYWEKDVMFMPTLDKERELIYVFGPSGSGKSYLSKMYAILYKKFNKGNDVFVLSHVKNDPSFEGMKYQHIPIDKEILDNTDLDTFKDSLVIFDDTDTPKDKEMQKIIDSLKDDIAQRGRHHNISAIFTTHMACNFMRTRVLLSECDKFVIFPGSGGNKQQEYMVCNYGGMPKSFFNNLKSYKSRWLMFNVRYPNYVVHQSGVELLS